MMVWYLRRAVPWSAPLGCLAAAALLVAFLHAEADLAVVVLLTSIALTGAAVGFCFDEAAVRVTSVLPRAVRWSPASRLVGAAGLTATGALLLQAAPAGTVADRRDGVMCVVAVGGAAALAGLLGHRAQHPHPGAWISVVVTFVALVPLAVGHLVDISALVPLAGFSTAQQQAWLGASALGWGTAIVLTVRGVRP